MVERCSVVFKQGDLEGECFLLLMGEVNLYDLNQQIDKDDVIDVQDIDAETSKLKTYQMVSELEQEKKRGQLICGLDQESFNNINEKLDNLETLDA